MKIYINELKDELARVSLTCGARLYGIAFLIISGGIEVN